MTTINNNSYLKIILDNKEEDVIIKIPMENIVKQLKAKRIRLTPQRIGIYKILTSQKKHLTADEIHGKIKNEFPAVSLATVYSVLELYKGKDIIREIRITFNRSCFESRTDSHHHFYCRECQEIFDINLHPCAVLRKKEVQGHLIEELQGYFYGICSKCRKNSV
ncbi:MAG: transcriptional repressor [Candidatus Omnitrophica bacterium]|nr:transcriptional repressor [Candidatus Omnitrophota bacterium]